MYLPPQATDIDLPPNSDIKYSIEDGDPLGNFTIDEDSGEVGVTGPLNYEAMDVSMDGIFRLETFARDQGVPSLSASVYTLIYVKVRQCAFHRK